MKKTQWKDAVRNIKKRIVSYLSVCLVVALGLGGLFTTRYMGAGLEKKATDWYDAHSFKDYDMVSSYGISEANLAKIKTIDGVIDAEGVLQADGSVYFDGQKRSATIISLTGRVSVPDVAEGKLPTEKNECMLGEDFAEVEGLKVGDKVRITATGVVAAREQIEDQMDMDMDMDMNMDIDMDVVTAGSEKTAEETADKEKDDSEEKDESPLYSKEFTVTGLMHHPDYLRRKSVNTVCLPLSAYDTKVTEGFYTRCFVRIGQPGSGMFSDKYFDETSSTREALEKLTDELAADRTKEVRDQANRMIDEKWAEAEDKLAEAQTQIDTGQAELDSRLADGRSKLNSAQDELNRKINKALKDLKNGNITVPEYNKTIKELKAELKKKKKELDEAQETLDEYRKEFEKDVKIIEGPLKKLIELVDKSKKYKDDPKYRAAELKIAKYIVENQEMIREMSIAIKSKKLQEIMTWLDDYMGNKKCEKALALLKVIDVDTVIDNAQAIVDDPTGDTHFSDLVLDYFRNVLKAIELFREQFDAAQAKIDKGQAEIAAAGKKLADGEKEIRKKIYSERDKYQRQIDGGWSQYYSEKSKYEKKLDEAIALLAENREEAEKKLAEAREAVNNIEQCEWIVLDRKGNAGYVDMSTNISAIQSMGVVFSILFTIITAIVCLSTLIIIIDEQKTLVGTSKAFGFRKWEVLAKYLVFGISAALVGAMLAILGAVVLSDIVQKRYAASGMYPIGVAKSIITVGPTILFSLLITAVTIAATVIACTDILRSPASILMKGAVLRKEKKNRKEKAENTASSKNGSLYSRLIIRNMIDDKARVLVTISIIAFSCMLIGLGISMKAAYDGMMDRQEKVVNRYDIRMDMNSDVLDEDEAALVSVLEKYDTDFMPATYKSALYRWGGRVDGATLICGNPERLKGFYGITDSKGNDITLPEDGILIQKRMHESYGMDAGDTLPILDDTLKEHEAEISGIFTNYVGRTVVMSPAAYKSIFGSANKTNCYFIRLNGADAGALEADLLKESDNISFTTRDAFKVKFESASKLYYILVIITTGIAILISFMILTNLANIYLTRKKTELTVMRVNGFTIRETKGYLSKESLITTTAGLILGVAIGAVLTPMIIKAVQQPDLEFVKSFHVSAWAIAIGLEALFAIVINTIVYRKVKDLNLKDIA